MNDPATHKVDVLVVGSGAGGAVTALELATQGSRPRCGFEMKNS